MRRSADLPLTISPAILLSGVGDGVVKILRDAKDHASYTYVLAVFFSVFSLLVFGWVIWSVWARKETKSAGHVLSSQFAAIISGGFSAWVAYEIIKRLMS